MLKTASTELRLDSSPFYRPGDKVTGSVVLRTNAPFSFENVQIKISCNEACRINTDRTTLDYQFTVGFRQSHFGKRDIKERNIKRDDSIMPHQEYTALKQHLKLTATIANPKSPKDSANLDKVLNPGEHFFNFDVLIPETANSCPPSCEIKEGLGVFWTLKAVIHRSGIKKSLRNETGLFIIPITPIPNLIDKLNTVTKLEGTKLLCRMHFNTATVSQPETTTDFKLFIEVPNGSIYLKSAELVLVRVCLAFLDDKALKNTLTHETRLGLTTVNGEVKGILDLSERLKPNVSTYMTPTFKSEYLNVSYKLKIVLTGHQTAIMEKEIVVPAPVLGSALGTALGVGTDRGTDSLPSYEDVVGLGA